MPTFYMKLSLTFLRRYFTVVFFSYRLKEDVQNVLSLLARKPWGAGAIGKQHYRRTSDPWPIQIRMHGSSPHLKFIFGDRPPVPPRSPPPVAWNRLRRGNFYNYTIYKKYKKFSWPVLQLITITCILSI